VLIFSSLLNFNSFLPFYPFHFTLCSFPLPYALCPLPFLSIFSSMTRKLSLLLPIILLTSCYKEIIPGDNGSTDSTGQSPASTSYIYDIQALPDIRLTIPLAEWNRLLSNFDQNPHNQEYIIGHFQFNKRGEISRLDSIGIRLRGNTSRRRPEGHTGQFHNRDNPDWHHAHFGIHFEEYRPGQRFSGTDRMHLKWFKDDAMYVREIYSYDLFHRFGVYTAPRSTYCKLTVHVEGDPEPAYFGVYEMVEFVNSLQRYFTLLEKREFYKLYQNILPRQEIPVKYITNK